MSNRTKIKDQMRSKKMTLDDLPSPHLEAVHTLKHQNVIPNAESYDYEIDAVVELDGGEFVQQEAVHTVNHQNVILMTDKSEVSTNQKHSSVALHNSNPTNTVIQQNSKEVKQESAHQISEYFAPIVNTAKQKSTVKVTYYLTPEMHKEFTEIHARRILNGRKTDKSVLICEAIELLSLKEKNNK